MFGIIFGSAIVYYYLKKRNVKLGVEGKKKLQEHIDSLKSEGADLPEKEKGGALAVSSDSDKDDDAFSSFALNREEYTAAKIKNEIKDAEEGELNDDTKKILRERLAQLEEGEGFSLTSEEMLKEIKRKKKDKDETL